MSKMGFTSAFVLYVKPSSHVRMKNRKKLNLRYFVKKKDRKRIFPEKRLKN